MEVHFIAPEEQLLPLERDTQGYHHGAFGGPEAEAFFYRLDDVKEYPTQPPDSSLKELIPSLELGGAKITTAVVGFELVPLTVRARLVNNIVAVVVFSGECRVNPRIFYLGR